MFKLRDKKISTFLCQNFQKKNCLSFQSSEPGSHYNIPLMNALVLYVGTQAIQHIHTKGLTPSMSTIAHSSHMDIFQNLAVDLDTEGNISSCFISTKVDLDVRKPVFGGLRTTKVQTSQPAQSDQRLCYSFIKYHI